MLIRSSQLSVDVSYRVNQRLITIYIGKPVGRRFG